MRYNKRAKSYRCHSLQLSKIFGEKTKAHHDAINKTEEQE